METPTAIFRGLKRDGQDGGLCYAGIPIQIHLDHNIVVPPPPGFTFLVFADENGHIFSWRWEKEDATQFRAIQWIT